MTNEAGDSADIESLLDGVRQGRADASDRLFALLYDDLRSQSHLLLRVGARQTLCTTELVNERLSPDHDSPDCIVAIGIVRRSGELYF